MEELIDEYKSIIINNYKKKINILENDLKKEDYPEEGRVYIFKEIDNIGEEYYRIGQSENLKNRIKVHDSSSTHSKIVIFKIKTKDIQHYEKCLLSTLYRYRYKNDFFKLPIDKLKKAIKNCWNKNRKTLFFYLSSKSFYEEKYALHISPHKNCEKVIKEFKNPNYIEIKGGKNIKIIKSFDDIVWRLNNDIKIYFSKVYKSIIWNLYDKINDAYYNGKKVTDKKLNEPVMTYTNSNKILIVPCQRNSEYFSYIELTNKEITYKQLFKILYRFYNKDNIDIKYIKNIPNDSDNLIEDAIYKLEQNKIVYRIDIMGQLCRFEGIDTTDFEHVYRLILGT